MVSTPESRALSERLRLHLEELISSGILVFIRLDYIRHWPFLEGQLDGPEAVRGWCAALGQHYPDAVILNELDREEAWVLFLRSLKYVMDMDVVPHALREAARIVREAEAARVVRPG
jgi:hypothetical protein